MHKNMLVAAGCLWLAAGPVLAEGWNHPGWQDSADTRVKALALLQTLNATLLSNSSATRTLQQWCAEHRMAAPAQIRALRNPADHKDASAEVRAQLRAQPDERVAYRRVQLACGEHALSEADNWYLPSKLTAEMNRQLDGSDVPFGRAVAALNFRRQTEEVKLLWSPLEAGWEMKPAPKAGAGGLDIAQQVLQHRAVLYRGSDNAPFSVVVETYQRDVFAFPLAY
ncbi:hypothetical protein [Chromobacterium sp. LK1]|uniref:hypothetical protein n=1 Tax=Chromobacterium sp. LK1 TaxID=1628193 RepID=UPI000B26C124|nr:hypothetical protein [Chromobacterium sp. LK1]